jgi:hypothetical protein
MSWVEWLVIAAVAGLALAWGVIRVYFSEKRRFLRDVLSGRTPPPGADD